MRKPLAPLGSCAACGHVFRLRKDGMVWSHLGWATGYRCPGSGHLPIGYFTEKPYRTPFERWIPKVVL